MNLISGKIWYTTNDRFEKEIHVCDYDIAGSEVCDLSLAAHTSAMVWPGAR